MQTQPGAGFLYVRSNHRYHVLSFKDIRYVESLKSYVKIVTCNGALIVLTSMRDVEAKLPQPLFCRIHRSFLIGMAHVKSFGRSTVLLGDLELPIGGTYLRELLKLAPVIG